MRTNDLTHIIREYRRFSPRSVRSALMLLADEFETRAGTSAAAVQLVQEKTIYLSGMPAGAETESLAQALKIPGSDNYLWIRLGGARAERGAVTGTPDFLKIPLFDGTERFGVFVLVRHEQGGFDRSERALVPLLSEMLSMRFIPLLREESCEESMESDEVLRIELLKSVGDDRRMKRVLRNMMDTAGCEYCAFYSAVRGEHFYLLLDGRELEPRVGEIRHKLSGVYRMFSNREPKGSAAGESIFTKNEEKNVSYLLGGSKIESYFFVPVMFASRLQGVLLFGSVRRGAFNREEIERFRRMADEDDRVGNAVVFSSGGEIEVLERLLEKLPFGGALVTEEGLIRAANTRFHELVRVRSDLPETIYEMSEVSPFNMQGIWEEYRASQRDLVDRELHGSTYPESSLSVTLVSLEGVSEEVDTLVLAKDMTESALQREETSEILATVSHELKTPLTALKNSLEILKGSGAGGVTRLEKGDVEYALPASRFLNTAARTIDRLVMLVNGLQNVTETRTISRPYNPAKVLLKSYLDDVSLFFLESMKKKDIDFSIEVSDRVSALEFDPGQMEQVIHNLISNSIKHVPVGGSIAIRANPAGGEVYETLPPIPWEYIDLHSFVDISVSDSGDGVPSDVIESINPSKHLGGVRRSASRGLGLFIAKKLIRMQGGSILIDRHDEGGSTVHLFLPADQSTRAVVRSAYISRESLHDMIGKGLKPVLYTVVKESAACWLEVAGAWKIVPAINPELGEISDTGFYLWPLGERIAIGLSADRRLASSPLSIVRNGRGGLRMLDNDSNDAIRIGWGVGMVDGTSYAEVMSAALKRTTAEHAYAVLKGEGEWTGTGF
jgi:signal transduction histidine kinase